MLGREDRLIQAVSDGRDALARLREWQCDVVVAGQGRNGFDGLKLLRRVRAIQPEARVIVTGDGAPQRILAAIREGAYSYVHKPLAGGPLPDVVTQALASGPWQHDIRVVSAVPAWISLDVRSKLDAADRAAHFLRELSGDLPPQIRDDITAALRELLMNAVEHGCKLDPRKWTRVALLRTPRSAIAHVHDPGKGFSLDMLPHAAISNPDGSPIKHVDVRVEEGRRPGGFGILMARNLVDELLYNERGNSVLFVKYLDEKPASGNPG